jgi:tetratricopeptide (TPR) repeat protein
MRQYVAASAGRADFEDYMLTMEANTAAYFGQLGKSKELTRRAVASAEGTERNETAAIFEAGQAVHEALLEDVGARHRAKSALLLSQGIYVQYQAALALTFTPEFARAESMAQDLNRQFPENTLVAVEEFQKILDHPGIVQNEVIGALAQLQLGRAYAMQGDTAKAKAAYQDFLTLWKDADPDIPIFIAAKAEYAKLH